MTYVLCVEFVQKIMFGSEMDFMRNGSGYFGHSKMFYILCVCERERERKCVCVCVCVCVCACVRRICTVLAGYCRFCALES